MVLRREFKLKFKGLYLVCFFVCGKYGHREHQCPKKPLTIKDSVSTEFVANSGKSSNIDGYTSIDCDIHVEEEKNVMIIHPLALGCLPKSLLGIEITRVKLTKGHKKKMLKTIKGIL